MELSALPNTAALLANTPMDVLSSAGRKTDHNALDKTRGSFLALHNMAALLANTAVDELSSAGRKIYCNALNKTSPAASLHYTTWLHSWQTLPWMS